MLFLKTNASVCCGLVHIGWILHQSPSCCSRQNPHHGDTSDSGCRCLAPRRVDTEVESQRYYRATISLSQHELTSARRYQYFSAGRISIAPPRRAAGTRAAILIAASTFSASRTKYPPTAPRTSTKGPFVVSVLPFCTRTVVASWGSPSGRPGMTPGVLFNASYSA